jgi:hypothetical protein
MSSGRRTESLFDNRYRCDYIYPRGRSGETLHAYDTQDDNRPVVIKRPASQDAPPMRAGQEVSIRNEKQALERLAGHPVLTELRGSGTFRVGGHTHEYIVMDLAEGQIVEDMVLELAEHGEYLPELEALVIMDHLLDLLAAAHDKQILYNDVDAKHLFWNRETYQLKVIDWGNAVFTDEPGALPTATRGSDIYQCGELLYFILTGGNRLLTETSDDQETFFVNFGPDAERIPARLQAILTRAVHHDPRRRYGTINELRQALAEYRQPLERERNEIVGRVRRRVRSTASQEELADLAAILDEALVMDPGYPEAAKLQREIDSYLQQIEVQADLDAIRIYLESGNWPRALSLLNDLLPKAGPANEALIRFLIEAASTLEDMQVSPPPDGFMPALDLLFEGQHVAAGQTLLTTAEARSKARRAQWLLAEQLATLVPEVTLLRPHLVRLRRDLESEADSLTEQLDAVQEQLDGPPLSGLTGLQVIYQQVASMLNRLEEMLETTASLRPAHEQEATLAAAIRAQYAAQAVAQKLDMVGQHVYSDPSHAGDLLHEASAIDPTAPHFDLLHDYFDEVHQAVLAVGQFKPRSDGANLAEWFVDVQDFLQPYLHDLADEKLHAAAQAVQHAGENWITIMNYLALGRREPTSDLLRRTADMIRPFNESLAAWFGTLATNLADAPFVERYSPREALADALIDGWKAWDRGQSANAIEQGKRAHQHATTDGERLAASRLQRLGELLEEWLTAGGPYDVERSDQAETEALAILLAEEEQERQTFAQQMPNTATYLRAMSRGIVAYMRESSSAGWRALFMHYVLRGILALLDGELDEAEFWRDVAAKAFDDASVHPAYKKLDHTLTARRLVLTAEQALNNVSDPEDLDAVRQALNAPLAGEVLSGVQQAVQTIQDALQSWSDGDFQTAVQSLNMATDNIRTAAQVADLRIDSFRAWLAELRDTAEELRQARLTLEQGALSTSDDPDPAMGEAHKQIVTLTLEKLGPDYAHQVRQWDDMYEAMLETYVSQRYTRREKLAAFSRHFSSLFITKHPLYPRFRHWESVIEQLPVDTAEDDVIDIESQGGEHQVTYVEEDKTFEPEAEAEPVIEDELPWNWIIPLALLLLVAAVAFGVWRIAANSGENGDNPGSSGSPGNPASAVEATPSARASGASGVPAGDKTLAPLTPTAEPATSTPVPPTATAVPPTPSPVPTTAVPLPTTAVPTPAVTATVAAPATPVPAAPPDLVAEVAALPADQRVWPADALRRGDGDVWEVSTVDIPDNTLTIKLSPAILDTLLEPGAASAFMRADATMTLVDGQAALDAGDVAFGLGAENTNGQQVIGQVQFVDRSLVELGMNRNGNFRARTELPLPDPQIRLSVRRVGSAVLGFYVNDQLLAESVTIRFPRGEPLTLVLLVTGQDVVVEISEFDIVYDIDSGSELP